MSELFIGKDALNRLGVDDFESRLNALRLQYEELVQKLNRPVLPGNGVYLRFENPVLTADHTPLEWRYDLNPESNPFLMERLGINAVFNAGAIRFRDKYVVIARVEGNDRKSFFALAESDNGIDGFGFRRKPIVIPELADDETNHYDMRLTLHEDEWIYGLFCVERKDSGFSNDTTAATAQCGIVRTRDLESWERLPDLATPSPQQRNAVLHPEFVDGRYAFYTRPQDGFIDAGSGGGIGWGLSESMNPAIVDEEIVIDPRVYHTITEVKNGQGPAPIRTQIGWIHLAHGVRNTAAGLRYVLYLFVTDLDEPWRVIYRPGGYFMAPQGGERVGDVPNVLFSNGWIADDDGTVYIYYASSDTRLHVALSSIDRLVDYVLNTPEDGLRSAESVRQRLALIHRNR